MRNKLVSAISSPARPLNNCRMQPTHISSDINVSFAHPEFMQAEELHAQSFARGVSANEVRDRADFTSDKLDILVARTRPLPEASRFDKGAPSSILRPDRRASKPWYSRAIPSDKRRFPPYN
jgi:hypothetical protein